MRNTIVRAEGQCCLLQFSVLLEIPTPPAPYPQHPSNLVHLRKPPGPPSSGPIDCPLCRMLARVWWCLLAAKLPGCLSQSGVRPTPVVSVRPSSVSQDRPKPSMAKFHRPILMHFVSLTTNHGGTARMIQSVPSLPRHRGSGDSGPSVRGRPEPSDR